MKINQRGGSGVEAILVLFLFAISIVLLYWISSTKCENRARMMGFKYSYALVQGCMIEHQPGKWIPIENYRQF